MDPVTVVDAMKDALCGTFTHWLVPLSDLPLPTTPAVSTVPTLTPLAAFAVASLALPAKCHTPAKPAEESNTAAPLLLLLTPLFPQYILKYWVPLFPYTVSVLTQTSAS
jgi:hypothetical protein